MPKNTYYGIKPIKADDNKRICNRCDAVLSRYNLGETCQPCIKATRKG